MPRKIDLKEIAQKNPTLDLAELARWIKLRKTLIETGMRGRRGRETAPFVGKRAQIVDDPENDPRLVRLSRD